MDCYTRCTNPNPSHRPAFQLWTGQQCINKRCQFFVTFIALCAVAINRQFINDTSTQVRECPVYLCTTQVYTQNHMTILVEFQQWTAPPTTPFGISLRTNKAILYQFIHNPHYSGQADVQSLSNGCARNRARSPDYLQDGRSIDIAHRRASNRKRIIHKSSFGEKRANLHGVIVTYSM